MKRLRGIFSGGAKITWACPYCERIFGAHPRLGQRCAGCGAKVADKGWIEPPKGDRPGKVPSGGKTS